MQLPQQIQAVVGSIGGLSRREQALLGGAGAVFLLLIATLTVVNIRSSLADRESRVVFKKQGLAQVVALSAGFREAEASRRALSSRLRGAPKGSLVSLMEGLAHGQGVAIAKMTPRRPLSKGGITENAVNVNFEPASLDKIASVINQIQRSPGLVKVSKLRLRKKFSSKEKVDVSFTVSSYHEEAKP